MNTSSIQAGAAPRESHDVGQLRMRELYKIFQPEHFKAEFAKGETRSPDKLLTSQAQLVALRLDARRCTISFLDKDTQYNVAEATKTVHLDNTTQHDATSDSLWLGCNVFSSENSMCLYTLAAQPRDDNVPASFEVLSVADDPRFSWLPFVHSPPYIKYYYGTPMRTSNGVVVGSLCVLDDKERSPMSVAEKKFLAVIAENVMTHLELLRERAERIRSTQMNKSLALFVNPQTPTTQDNYRREYISKHTNVKSSKRGKFDADQTSIGAAALSPEQPTEVSGLPPPKSKFTHDGSLRDSITKTERFGSKYISDTKTDEYLQTFRYAATLLLNSFDIAGGGSVIFLGTSLSNHGEYSSALEEAEGAGEGGSDSSVPLSDDSQLTTDTKLPKVRKSRGRLGGQKGEKLTADVLTYMSASTVRSIDSQERYANEDADECFSPIPVEVLARLIKRYPRGRFWTFDEEGHPYSDFEDAFDEDKSPHVKSKRTIRTQAEAHLLLRYLPGAYQIIFCPFWDMRSSRWCVCLVSNSSRFRTFTYQTDFLYAIGFCNCVQIELARVAVQIQDRQKADFIGSISHELRSPLHGIMASCEFLHETESNPFQQSLIDTVDSCARTLLNTINMVLDYSKINSFERDWRKTRTSKASTMKLFSGVSLEGNLKITDQPVLNIYGNVDLAAITEEVVEGVTTGQIFQDISTIDEFEIEPRKARKADGVSGKIPLVAGSPADITYLDEANVEVILDISQRNWAFITQPGAFRRIVMNLVGNALKYTKKGYIKICLDAYDGGHERSGTDTFKHESISDIIELSVADTGIGMSEDYLRTRLFTAFSQEDQLASGTGLGLCLVKSIVTLLEGEIEVQSKLNEGTKVIVKIPMILQSSLNDTLAGSEEASDTSDKMDIVASVREIFRLKKVAYFTPQTTVKKGGYHWNELCRLRNESLERYVWDWYGIKAAKDWPASSEADIVFLDEDALPNLLSLFPCGLEQIRSQHVSFVILCSKSSRHKYMNMYDSGRMEFVSKPFGPYKLAKVLRFCLDHQERPIFPTSTSRYDTHAIGAGRKKPSALVDQATLITHDSQINLIEIGSVIGNEDSSNARKAMLRSPKSMNIESIESTITEQDPLDSAIGKVGGGATPIAEFTQTFNTSGTMSPIARELKIAEAATTATTTTPLSRVKVIAAGDKEFRSDISLKKSKRLPRLLLVDDNAINLRLLQTFMKKRKYQSIRSASDGAEAVHEFQIALNEKQPHDIVFMDISMPIMNGFEATRRIRTMEQESFLGTSGMRTQAPALIIALTGLASGRDQSEAFSSGVDLYMTKPVSFKEISRLLDNWETSGGADMADSALHESVSDMVVPQHVP